MGSDFVGCIFSGGGEFNEISVIVRMIVCINVDVIILFFIVFVYLFCFWVVIRLMFLYFVVEMVVMICMIVL